MQYAVYGIDAPIRAITPLHDPRVFSAAASTANSAATTTSTHLFMVGSAAFAASSSSSPSSLQQSNSLYLLEYHESGTQSAGGGGSGTASNNSNKVSCLGVFPHTVSHSNNAALSPEIVAISAPAELATTGTLLAASESSSTSSSSLAGVFSVVSAVSSGGGGLRTFGTIYQLRRCDDASSSASAPSSTSGLLELASLGTLPTGTTAIAWSPHNMANSSGGSNKKAGAVSSALVALVNGELVQASVDPSTTRANTSSNDGDVSGVSIIASSAVRLPLKALQEKSAATTTTNAKNASPNTMTMQLLRPHLVTRDPHHEHLTAVAIGGEVVIVNHKLHNSSSASAVPTQKDGGSAGGGPSSSSGAVAFVASNAHGFGHIQSLCYAPNRLHLLLTGGDDGYVCCWDARVAASNAGQCPAPLLRVRMHDHAIRGCALNSLSDNLLLTGGGDRAANLWQLAGSLPTPAPIAPPPLTPLGGGTGGGTGSLSSSFATAASDVVSHTTTPQTTTAGTKTQQVPSNAHHTHHHHQPYHHPLSKRSATAFGDFGDAVTATCWGVASPWAVAAASYSGKIAFATIPDAVRHEVLLAESS